jgi:hypothetical protein
LAPEAVALDDRQPPGIRRAVEEAPEVGVRVVDGIQRIRSHVTNPPRAAPSRAAPRSHQGSSSTSTTTAGMSRLSVLQPTGVPVLSEAVLRVAEVDPALADLPPQERLQLVFLMSRRPWAIWLRPEVLGHVGTPERQGKQMVYFAPRPSARVPLRP